MMFYFYIVVVYTFGETIFLKSGSYFKYYNFIRASESWIKFIFSKVIIRAVLVIYKSITSIGGDLVFLNVH